MSKNFPIWKISKYQEFGVVQNFLMGKMVFKIRNRREFYMGETALEI